MSNKRGYLKSEISELKETISFLSYKGDAIESTLDQLSIPPEMGFSAQLGAGLFHSFGEWLKREGHDWKFISHEKLCRLGTEYFNLLQPENAKRRFHMMMPSTNIKCQPKKDKS